MHPQRATSGGTATHQQPVEQSRQDERPVGSTQPPSSAEVFRLVSEHLEILETHANSLAGSLDSQAPLVAALQDAVAHRGEDLDQQAQLLEEMIRFVRSRSRASAPGHAAAAATTATTARRLPPASNSAPPSFVHAPPADLRTGTGTVGRAASWHFEHDLNQYAAQVLEPDGAEDQAEIDEEDEEDEEDEHYEDAADHDHD
eukprot:m.300314 g.300314  ORF g.300314 m.300314 type:complete len:201 (+) comp55208_c0_seq27:281-883(+)